MILRDLLISSIDFAKLVVAVVIKKDKQYIRVVRDSTTGSLAVRFIYYKNFDEFQKDEGQMLTELPRVDEPCAWGIDLSETDWHIARTTLRDIQMVLNHTQIELDAVKKENMGNGYFTATITQVLSGDALIAADTLEEAKTIVDQCLEDGRISYSEFELVDTSIEFNDPTEDDFQFLGTPLTAREDPFFD